MTEKNSKIRKAFITDWLEKYGGAERVVTAISEVYDFDYYYAYVNKMNEETQTMTFAGKKVIVEDSPILNKFKKRFRYLLPFFPFMVWHFNRQTRKNKVDLVISSSWSLSKAYRIGSEVHVCYLQARNFKYVWDEAYLYFKGPLKLLYPLKIFIQRFDLRTSKTPDYLIANSEFVSNWVQRYYNREATVIYPPVDVDDFYISPNREDYYITVGRIEPYKRFDIIVDAFKSNKKPLKIIGNGTQLKKLKENSAADSNIEYMGLRSKSEIIEMVSKAKGFVYAGVEDFGIVLVEALASGVPVIAYREGAAQEIVQDGRTGVLYDDQTPGALNAAIQKYENILHDFVSADLRESAFKFSKSNFKEQFAAFINNIKIDCEAI
jgi:glycosyltransferase involved in cell wall biosynthesis